MPSIPQNSPCQIVYLWIIASNQNLHGVYIEYKAICKMNSTTPWTGKAIVRTAEGATKKCKNINSFCLNCLIKVPFLCRLKKDIISTFIISSLANRDV